SSGGITGATGAPTLNFSASDIADASTPAGSATNNAKALVIDAPLSLTLTSGAPASAVAGRAYGTGTGCTGSGGNCAPITYSISNGLGGYTSSIAVSGSPTAITGLGCTLSGSTYSCLASTLGPANLSLVPSDTLTVSTSDTANPSTPSATVNNNLASLTIDPAMAIAPALGQGAPATAVVGSPYGSGAGCTGSGGACAPIKYTVSGGLGNYGAATLTESSQALTGISCPLSGSTYSCSSTSLGPTSLSSPVAADTLSIAAT
ncbi:MAG: hypothetical protein ACRD2P_11180, partial [Terriglobia bacterium]